MVEPSPGREDTSETARFLEIEAAGTRMLIPVDRVIAVVQTPRVTPVPGAPDTLVGVLNHQGAILPALRASAISTTPGRHSVIVDGGSFGRLAILCDWAADLTASLDPPHPILDVARLAAEVADGFSQHPSLPMPDDPRAVLWLRSENPDRANSRDGASTE